MVAADKLGSERKPLRVAVVGSGPSGFYTTEALIRSDHVVRIDMYERLPAPYGLVRYGVAPDHPKLKQAIQVYDTIAQSPQFAFFGNITVGRDVSVEELRRAYHAVVFTCGAETDRRLGIDGEDLPGSHTATEFVAWYNGHPDYRDRQFDLSHEVAVIIGQGNVAADVARILAKTVDELKHTDITDHALDVLANSRIREIRVIGRRGPAQAKFTPKELREFGELDECDPVVDPAELKLNPQSEQELTDKTNVNGKKNMELFEGFANSPAAKPRRCVFQFLRSPVRIVGERSVEKIVIERNELEGEPFRQSAKGTGEYEEVPCGALFRSIGYRGVAIPGVPFDQKRGIFRNTDGRLMDDNDTPLPGLYTAGWIKRGPTGIIGTNRADSVATVKALLEDIDGLDTGESKTGAEGLRGLLAERGIRVISYDDWRRIDAAEMERGKPKGKPREKYTRISEMLEVLE